MNAGQVQQPRGRFARGWQCQFIGDGCSAYIKKRLMFDFVPGQPGSGGRIPPEHPPWLTKVGVQGKPKVERWFWSMEEALEWANNELKFAELKRIE